MRLGNVGDAEKRGEEKRRDEMKTFL